VSNPWKSLASQPRGTATEFPGSRNAPGNGRVGCFVKLRAIFFLLAILAAGLPIQAQRVRTEYALVLEDPPVAAQIRNREGLHEAAADDRRARILDAQSTLVGDLQRRGFQVSGSTQTLLNAVFVRASEDRLDELKSLAGVRGVALVPPMKLHLNQAAGLINAPAAWTALGGTGNAGAGVKIGILDTGIDQTHAAFQDTSLTVPAGYPKCAGSDCAYTNNKVIVARSYVSYLTTGGGTDPQNSRPDDLSPRDHIGHGTANAMIAAGRPNTSPDSISITGIAPKAFLGNYKIYGSPGVNDYTLGSAVLAALEDAFLDGMDIVSMSFGSPAVYGPLDRGASCGVTTDPTFVCDIRATAVENAVARGMAVVVSAGNDADLGFDIPIYNVISTPATAPSAITVGASTNSHVFFNSVRLPGGDVPQNLQRLDALLGDSAIPAAAVTAPLRDVATIDTSGLACGSLTAGSLNGALALVLRGTCAFAQKVNNAQAAGAVGVIIYLANAADGLFPPSGLTSTTIPAVMIDNASGVALKSFLAGHANHIAVIDPLLAAQDATANEIASFSSRGPTIGEFGLKPELVAVGTDVFTATQSYDPNSDMWNPAGYGAYSGTSFSTPMVAGAAALVHQKTAGLTPADIKSTLVNTASAGIQDPALGRAADILTTGAGKLDVNAAISSNVSADPAAVSFGNVSSTWPPTPRTLKLRNLGSTPVTVTLSAPSPLNLSQTSLTLAPGAAATQISISLTGSQPVAGSYQGFITISGGAVSLRVPYLYIRPDGIPFNVMSLYGSDFVDIPGGFTDYPEQIAIKVIDRYGAPVANVPVLFGSTTGGTVQGADSRTDVYGIAAANVLPSYLVGDQEFYATAATMTVYFNGTTIAPPAIGTRGVVNAASFKEGQGQAPGSYISLFGSGLSTATKAFGTAYLPLSLAGVSVSFDATGLSVPGRVHFVSPNQVNVQVPWELSGKNTVQTKVSIGDISTAVYSLTLNNYSPALFQRSGIVAARWNNAIVETTNPAPRTQSVELYCNGLGPVDRAVASGEATPSTPPINTTATPTVTIGGVQAQVTFSGLTPTAIGLYQINVVVPASAPTGLQPVVVTIGGVSSDPVNLPIS
jgi:minor extracellular serine protease Vpr